MVGSGPAAAGQCPVPGWLPPSGAHRREPDPCGAGCRRGGAGDGRDDRARAVATASAGAGPAGGAAFAVDRPAARGPDVPAVRGYAAAAEGGGDRMSAQALMLTPGARLIYDGDLVEVVELDGARVVVRNSRTAGFATVRFGRLVAGATPADSPPAAGGPPSPGMAWTGLSDAQRAAVSERAGQIREVLTGYRAGHAESAAPGEPRPQYAPSQPLKARYQAKARELSVGERTVQRWAMAYRACGEAG